MRGRRKLVKSGSRGRCEPDSWSGFSQTGGLSAGKLARAAEAQSMKDKPEHNFECRKSVDNAPAEADRTRFLEVAGGNGNLADPHVARHRLGYEFLVEHEVVAVEPIGDRFEQVAAISPKAGVVFGQVQTDRKSTRLNSSHANISY